MNDGDKTKDQLIQELALLRQRVDMLEATNARLSVKVKETGRLEAQVHQSQKLEAIGQLAGGIAHDFNNLLTAIMGYSTLLSSKLDEADPLRDYSNKILAASEKAAQLTRGLLAFGRRQLIDLRAVDVNSIIKDTGDLLSRLIGEDIELTVSPADACLTIMADAGQIGQIIMNLATNARDAMPEGGAMVIKAERLAVAEESAKEHRIVQPGEYACISVIDTGTGMEAAHRERIFEPFFTTKKTGKGTGLGLSAVYGIVKQHNGYIFVESELGRGTTFKLFFPLAQAPVKSQKPATVPLPMGGTETILVADDGEEVRKYTKKVLEEFGYTVIESVDGEDAVRKFREHQNTIQLLLLDVVMPKRNGKEAYDEIRKLRPDIKVVFTSGYTADIIHKKGVLEKKLNFLQKPVLPDVLLRKIQETLAK